MKAITVVKAIGKTTFTVITITIGKTVQVVHSMIAILTAMPL